MVLFSILWAPLFYFFWHSITAKNVYRTAGIWPYLVGICIALPRLLFKPAFPAQGQAIDRLIGAFFEYTSLCPLLALLACVFLPALFKSRVPFEDWTGFLLAVFIPAGIAYGMVWSTKMHPLYLVLPPLLWTSAALAANLLRRRVFQTTLRIKVVSSLLFAALLVLNAASWQAFFYRSLILGAVLGAPSLAVSIASLLNAVLPPAKSKS
ncbi:MAG: hypothetical protein LBG74_03885 [Spirochaetaceae bacterium]|jgi:hypothetical protein|nr:hypothetical protein [Spirochaetaceae bacterium]